ncbi:MAG: DUF362 domain-containing protein [Candidatus Coatesbacteria bacterium]|nr:MAG: DUF362 domain-containing protein [Candidatus Coatesbacteria bacterium]
MPIYNEDGSTAVRDDLFFSGSVKTSAALRGMLGAVGCADKPVLVKVNWFSGLPAQFTDAATLDLFLEALGGPAVVIEGHSFLRNDGSREITVGNARDNAEWIREQENAYLVENGLTEVIEKHGARYVNVTDEVWAGRTIDPSDVRTRVEERFGPLTNEELYDKMPEALLEFEGAPLISLARLKLPASVESNAPTLSLKNLFGLVPEPNRSSYHDKLPETLIDVRALYGSYFTPVGVVEAVYHGVREAPDGVFEVPWGRYNDIGTVGLAVVGANPADVDAFAAGLFGGDVSTRTVMSEYERRIGPWDRMLPLEAARYAAVNI